MSVKDAAEPCYLAGHGYEFDMFFSYAHGDVRRTGDAQLKRWSKQLYQALSDTLDSLNLKPPPRIFFDESDAPGDGLNKTAHLAPELAEKVRASALLQIVMSPQYLASGAGASSRRSRRQPRSGEGASAAASSSPRRWTPRTCPGPPS